MTNPFEEVRIKPEVESPELASEHQQQMAKRDAIYAQYDPMVNEILDQFIAAHRQGVWEKDSDCSRRYCCHISWFAGPKEKYSDPYDTHHTLRRRIEIKLEMDGFCNPTGFTVINYEAIEKTIHVSLEKDDLIRGITAVMA
ncbi:hypothetical protein FDZ74_09185 [bacterium]|nr:MAG: hypothetical protein FDZ74_09185 [bacterium]